MQVEEAEARPIACRPEHQALGRGNGLLRVGLEHERADAELVEQRALRKRQVLFAPFGNGKLDQIAGENRIGVAIPANRAGRPLLRPRGRVAVDIGGPV